jgi:hypothetical protein
MNRWLPVKDVGGCFSAGLDKSKAKAKEIRVLCTLQLSELEARGVTSGGDGGGNYSDGDNNLEGCDPANDSNENDSNESVTESSDGPPGTDPASTALTSRMNESPPRPLADGAIEATATGTREESSREATGVVEKQRRPTKRLPNERVTFVDSGGRRKTTKLSAVAFAPGLAMAQQAPKGVESKSRWEEELRLIRQILVHLSSSIGVVFEHFADASRPVEEARLFAAILKQKVRSGHSITAVLSPQHWEAFLSECEITSPSFPPGAVNMLMDQGEWSLQAPSALLSPGPYIH